MRATLTAGDTLDFTTSVANYPASDGWTLKYRLVPRDNGNAAIDITAAAEGDDYRVQLAPDDTDGWDAGEYGWSSWLEKTGARHSVSSGLTTILADPEALAPGADTRSQAQKAVDDLLAAKATFTATNGNVKRYVIGNREMEFKTSSEIDQQYIFWQARLTREKAEQAVAQGLADPRRIYLQARRA